MEWQGEDVEDQKFDSILVPTRDLSTMLTRALVGWLFCDSDEHKDEQPQKIVGNHNIISRYVLKHQGEGRGSR